MSIQTGDTIIPVLYNVESLHAGPLTGVGHYTACLLEALLARDDVATRCFCGARLVPATSTKNIQPTAPASALRRSLPQRIVGKLAWSVVGLRAVRRAAFWYGVGRHATEHAIYHEPNHILKPINTVAVTTIHDLSTIHYPQYHPVERLRYFHRELPRTLARAARILTVSEFSRQDIIATLGVPPERVSVTYNGVHERFRPVAPAAAAVLAQWGLSYGNYILSVGTREPRKNLLTLISAFKRLPQRLRRQHPLVLVGTKGWLHESCENQLDLLERSGEAVRLGYVPLETLPALYSGAAGFAFLSIYEGFGLPALEAAACGVPVLTSASTAMAEIVGDIAILVNPLDPDACAEGLRRLLDDDANRTRVQSEGPQLAAHYTWQRTANETVAAYTLAMATAR